MKTDIDISVCALCDKNAQTTESVIYREIFKDPITVIVGLCLDHRKSGDEAAKLLSKTKFPDCRLRDLMVVDAGYLGATALADFLRFITSYEIPILSIKADAGPMVVEKDHDSNSITGKTERARFNLVAFPRVACTYVLEVERWQAEAAIAFFEKQPNRWKVQIRPFEKEQSTNASKKR